MNTPKQIFTEKTMRDLFPPERTDDFFEALFGDASEGAFDISLSFSSYDEAAGLLTLHLNLQERPGRCLACNLTYGLPEVFSRHPLINIKGIVAEVEGLLGGELVCESWRLDHTIQKDRSLHCIPLRIEVRPR